MGRAMYSDDLDPRLLASWRGAVSRAIHGRRGQALLRELLVALDEMPRKRLITGELEEHGEFCALGALGHRRGLSMDLIDPDDYEQVARKFDCAEALVREIEFLNDEACPFDEPDEQRWKRMRAWVASQIKGEEE